MLEQALPPLENGGDLALLAATLVRLGRSLAAQGMLAAALASLSRALAIGEELGDVGAQSVALNELGRTYEGQNRLAEALSQYRRALELCKQTENALGVVEALGNCANILDLQGEADEARELFSQLFTLAEETGDHEACARAYFVAARSLWRHGDRAGSVAYLEKSVAQHRESGMRRETMRELERLAASYGEIGQTDKAKAALGEAELLRAQVSTE
jgi:tetratricopeptide (TPR) repeat protein